MSNENNNTVQSPFPVLQGVRFLTLVVFIGVAAAFAGGLLTGWASSGRPSTLSQAIQQADNGVLPSGIPSPATPTTSTNSIPSPASPASLYNLAFFGIISSLYGNQLGVETKAGQVSMELTGKTHFATVNLAQSNRSRLLNGSLVLIVPYSSTQTSADSIAGTVVLLPN